VFAHHEVRVGVGAAVTDRYGGVSTGLWSSLDLADHVGDDPAAVQRNRALVLAAATPAAAGLVTMRQEHGADVAVVDRVGDEPAADALVTTTAGLVLAVLVADCAPVLLWDRRARVVAAVHVGRRGLAAGVLPATLDVMAMCSARPERIYAVVGPAICAEHYAMPAEMRDAVDRQAPGSAAMTSDGLPALDIRAGLLRQLRGAGVRQHMVMPHCTAETPAYFSYRRDGVTGRFAGLVWLET
jgi:YfiH family protein